MSYEELLPGAHVIVRGDASASIGARQAGLQFRDTILVLSPGPKSELLSVFRKPLSESTVAEQALKTGTGGFNVDTCRVGKQHTGGRWPPNFVLIHTPECVPGTAKVNGHKGYPNGPGGSSAQFSQKGVPTTRTAAWAGHADADGMETIPAWTCAVGCPVPLLDLQSGDRRSAGFFPQFGSYDELYRWLISLISPSGGLLFFR